MKTRVLGSAGPVVSRLAYGCWRLAGSEGGPRLEPSAGRRAVHAALDAGYTFLDLADIYGGGECERIAGEALRERPGSRDGVVVASKCGIRRAGDPAGAVGRYDFSADHIQRSVEGSLARLGIDALDVLLLHRPDYLMEPEEVAGAFAALLAAGKVRHFGVSNFRTSQVEALARACPMPLVTHQVEASLMHLAPFEDGTLDQCLMKGMTPTAWSPLGRGVLGNGSLEGFAPAVAARAARLHGELDGLASGLGLDRAGTALAWVLRHPSRPVPVVGSVDPARIASMARAADVEMGRDDWYRLLVASRGERLP